MAKLIPIDPKQWIDDHFGQIYDIDGAFGIQCVDLYKIFLKDIGYPDYNRPIGGDGYADNIWYNRMELGLAEYFDFIEGELKLGDIVIWAKGSEDCPSSHVAMFVENTAGDNRAIIFGSNQGEPHSPGNMMNLSCNGALGALRYKGFTTNEDIYTNKEGSVHRLYNPASGDHLYTVDFNEVQACRANGWLYEGVAWISPEKGYPVYRLYDGKFHYYTADPEEKSAYVHNGWTEEGIAFRSNGKLPIYKMYNPNSGEHVLTASRKEHDALTNAHWYCEGQPLHYEEA